eukprot:1160701-Pelagomonas_calceolata.AAC.5
MLLRAACWSGGSQVALGMGAPVTAAATSHSSTPFLHEVLTSRDWRWPIALYCVVKDPHITLYADLRGAALANSAFVI